MKIIYLFVFSLITIALSAQTDNYGADKANKRVIADGQKFGGRTNYNYLALEDHPSRSGVPLGGIGVGNVQLAPNGRFVRIGLNNIHLPMARSKAAFFTCWTRTPERTSVRRLVLDSVEQYGMQGVQHSTYKGLFPQVTWKGDDSALAVRAGIHAWSGLAPQDIKNSSLPVVYFDIELEAREDCEVALAFSWEDFIGRGIKDPRSLEGMDGQILSRSNLMNGEEWPEMPARNTFAGIFNGPTYQGIRQFSREPIIPRKATFQNYVTEVAILALAQPGNRISAVPAYDRDKGDEAWQSFIRDGVFAAQPDQVREALSVPGTIHGASALAIKTRLKKGEKRTLRFMLVWFFPELKINKATAEPGSYWPGGSDYGRYFHNYFNSLDQLVQYGIGKHDFSLEKINEWQSPILQSTLPDWYKFKLINSAYVIYTNMILNKKGDVTVNEGGMGGLAGTMDQRISSHPFYQKFFTGLDRSEMEIFGDAQAFDGSINHFIGHYYVGMGTVGGRAPTENHWMLDNTEGWIIQVIKDYEQTGDLHYLKKWVGRIKDGMKFLKSKMPEGVEIPLGPTTYDDFTHPPIYSYGAGMYLASLKAAEAAANALQDTAWARACKEQFLRSQNDMLRLLWNGHFFSYGCQVDGSGRLDNILFTGQLAGEFISRYCGWGDIFPLSVTQSSLRSQFDISLSKTPDYYANKVWDIQQGKGIDQRGSQCWPFYLESYTAYPAIQAGYIADGLDIMRHIQLVHLRKGLTWCQNLWNPGDITYMTGPVSWFSTDVLAGAGINVPKGELRLAPCINEEALSVYPLYYPGFWATVTVDHQKKKVLVKITKTFGGGTVTLRKLLIEAAGRPTDEAKEVSLSPFEVITGRVLDLSNWYDDLMNAKMKESTLTQAPQ